MPQSARAGHSATRLTRVHTQYMMCTAVGGTQRVLINLMRGACSDRMKIRAARILWHMSMSMSMSMCAYPQAHQAASSAAVWCFLQQRCLQEPWTGLEVCHDMCRSGATRRSGHIALTPTTTLREPEFSSRGTKVACLGCLALKARFWGGGPLMLSPGRHRQATPGRGCRAGWRRGRPGPAERSTRRAGS